jgi:hypothetical protein
MSAGEELQRIYAQVGGCCCSVVSRLLVLHTMLLPQLIIVRLHMAAAAKAMMCSRVMALTPFPAVWSCLVV